VLQKVTSYIHVCEGLLQLFCYVYFREGLFVYVDFETACSICLFPRRPCGGIEQCNCYVYSVKAGYDRLIP
jgi:hypothetical protein